MPKTSPATRLLAILERAQSTRANQATVDGWAQVFEIAETRPMARAREVTRLVPMVHDQLELVRAQLASQGVNMNRFIDALRAIDATLTIHNLTENWGNTLNRLQGPTMPLLGSIAEFCPRTDAAIGDQDLTDLGDEIMTWRERVAKSDLPDVIQRFLWRQFELIERAMREYPIRGAGAFQDASMEAAVEWATHEEEVRPYRNREEVAGARRLWPRIATIGAGLLLIHSLLTAFDADTSLAARVVQDWRELTTGVGQRALPPGQPTEQGSVEDGAESR